MKTKHYRYYPYGINGVVLAVLEVFQALSWVYVGAALSDFLDGKILWPMVFLLAISMGFLSMRYMLFRQYSVSLCFTEDGISIVERPGREQFILWEALPYGYFASTSRLEYLVLSPKTFTRKELNRLVRRAAYGWRVVIDGTVYIPRHLISGTTPGIANLGEVLPESVRLLEPEDTQG